jgi:hypothetical protein
MILRCRIASVVLAIASVSCSGAAAPEQGFPADPYTTVTSDSGGLVVDVRTSPQPPARGTNSVELRITRAADGVAVTGLSVAVRAWMPSMNHGSSDPTVVDEGGGKYLVRDVYLYMPGTWQLQTTFAGPLDDHATASFGIP